MIWIAASVALQLGALALLKLMIPDTGRGLLRILGSPYFIGALALLAAQSLVWQLALRRYPLNFAYCLHALIYPAGLAVGFLAFGEPPSLPKLAGVGLIIAGVAWGVRSV